MNRIKNFEVNNLNPTEVMENAINYAKEAFMQYLTYEDFFDDVENYSKENGLDAYEVMKELDEKVYVLYNPKDDVTLYGFHEKYVIYKKTQKGILDSGIMDNFDSIRQSTQSNEEFFEQTRKKYWSFNDYITLGHWSMESLIREYDRYHQTNYKEEYKSFLKKLIDDAVEYAKQVRPNCSSLEEFFDEVEDYAANHNMWGAESVLDIMRELDRKKVFSEENISFSDYYWAYIDCDGAEGWIFTVDNTLDDIEQFDNEKKSKKDFFEKVDAYRAEREIDEESIIKCINLYDDELAEDYRTWCKCSEAC